MRLASEIGIQSGSFHDVETLEELRERVRALGVRRIELAPRHLAPALSQVELKEALVALACGGIAASGWGVFPAGGNVRDDRALLLRAQVIGVPVVGVDPEPGALRALGALAAEYGVRAAIHNDGPGHRWGTLDALGRAMGETNAWVGVCLDTASLLRAGGDPVAAVHALGSRLFGVHLSDAARTDGGAWEPCVLGEGALRLRPFLARLAAAGFKGVLSLEYENRRGDPVQGLRASLAALAAAGEEPEPPAA